MIPYCCGTAVLDEKCCPSCNKEVVPHDPRYRFKAAYARWNNNTL